MRVAPLVVGCGSGQGVGPKADNIQHVGPGCYIWYQSRPHWLSGCADGDVGLLKGVDCEIPYRRVRVVLLALLVVLVLTC